MKQLYKCKNTNATVHTNVLNQQSQEFTIINYRYHRIHIKIFFSATCLIPKLDFMIVH